MLTSFFIRNKAGRGLHYVQGSLFWNDATTVEKLLGFTKFDSPLEAREFIAHNRIPGDLTIAQISYPIQRVQEDL